MDIERIKDILSSEFGINDEEELYEVMDNLSGINLGIFKMDLSEVSIDRETKGQEKIA